MDDNQLSTLLSEISNEAKHFDKEKYFEYSEDAVEMAERIKVHSENGKFPHRLFVKRAPNQTAEEFEYIKANHKTISYPVWSKFTSQLGRIWNDNNWSIIWNQESIDSGAKSYIDSEFKEFRSVESYFKNIITYQKEKDPNSVLAIKPYELPVIEDEQGNISFDETALIEPIIVTYESKNVVWFNETYALFLTDENSECIGINGNKEKGFVFEFYTKDAIYKVMQFGQTKDFNFEMIPYYVHNLGYLPCAKLKAIPIQEDGEVIYQSNFFPAVDSLDEMLLDNSYLKAVKAGHAFPHKWEYVDECDFRTENASCVDGQIWNEERKAHITCPKCKGTGNKKPGILGVYQVKMPTNLNEASAQAKIPPFGWDAPNTEILSFLREEIEKNKRDALSVLNLQSDSDVKGSDTALGKMVDREDAFSMLMVISNQIFENFEFAIKAIIDMRYQEAGSNYYPNINYPKNFNIRSEAELTQEVAIAKSQNLPEFAFRQLTIELMNRRFSENNTQSKVLDIVFYSDRLIMLSSLEVAQKKASNSIANWEDILHTSIYSFIAEQINNDPTFLDKTIDEQKNILIEVAKTKDAEINKPSSVADTIFQNIANGR